MTDGSRRVVPIMGQYTLPPFQRAESRDSISGAMRNANFG